MQVLEFLLDGGAAGLLYKLGFVRSEMKHAKDDVAAQVSQIRQEAKERDAQIHQRIDAFERMVREGFARLERSIASLLEYRVESERWRGGVESTTQSHDQRLDQLEHALMTGAGKRVVT